MKDLKYLAAYSIPIMALIGFSVRGSFVYLTPFFTFIFIPLLELIFPIDSKNLSLNESTNKLKNKFFDWLLYINLLIVYGLLFYILNIIKHTTLENYEFIGLIISLGIVLAANGINVGHELGHRQTTKERFLGKALLLPSLYMHFYIEHNFGHHLNAATKEDPATARYNQSVYAFWFTSVVRQYINAWKIQKSLLNNKKLPFLSIKNDMFWFLIIQSLYVFIIYLYFGLNGCVFAISAAITGFILLETVNYIEHYGLLRLKKDSGRYERVSEIHSWNSNHIIGRIILYELTRHSDHHYKTSKKYQILDCHEDSPQMPYGYPTSMVLAMLPPIWFLIMNKRIPREMIPR